MASPAPVITYIPAATRKLFEDERTRLGISNVNVGERTTPATSTTPPATGTTPPATGTTPPVYFPPNPVAPPASSSPTTSSSTTPPAGSAPPSNSTSPASSTSPAGSTPPTGITQADRQKALEEAKKKQEEEKKKQEEEEAKKAEEDRKNQEAAQELKTNELRDKQTAQDIVVKAFGGEPDKPIFSKSKRISPPSVQQKQFEIARNIMFNAAQKRRRGEV